MRRINDRIANAGMADQDRAVTTPPPPLILKDDEAERQRQLLVALKAALADVGVQSIVARNHHIGLPTEYAHVSGACGLKAPILFVRAADDSVIRVQVSDRTYVLATGQSFPAGDTETAAREISSLLKTSPANRSLPSPRTAREGTRRHA
jgi:hypothetical protein